MLFLLAGHADIVGLSDDRIGVELAIGIRHLLIDVLF